jgi:UDP-glucose 4,6-dehydratase
LATAGKKLPIHGDGAAKRSYMYVSDVANAFDVILHNGETWNIYNIGTSEERSIMSVAEDVCEIAGCVAEQMIQLVDDRAFNDRRYFIDTTKLEKLGWSQKVSWQEGLLRTYEWYIKHGEDYWPDLSTALMAHPQAPRHL